jgi:hypothetical protein
VPTFSKSSVLLEVQRLQGLAPAMAGGQDDLRQWRLQFFDFNSKIWVQGMIAETHPGVFGLPP